jgi:diketogulonate reductase-like aldo/keto reductase
MVTQVGYNQQMDAFVTSTADVRSPRILYGTAWKKEDTESLVRTAILQGFRGIDTACQPKHYHEPGVGAGVASFLDEKASNGKLAREDLYLQTKFTPLSGQDPARIPYDPKAPLAEQVRQSFAVSLRNLRTDYLDCLVLHSPLPNARQSLEVWQTMESLVDARGVRQLGISNCYQLEQLQTLCDSARFKPAVVQNRFYADTGYDRGIRTFCRQNGIVYQSFWTLSANPHLLAHRTVRELAARHGRTPAQILFRYLTQNDIVPLIGTRSETHMREDLAIFEFELADTEREAMDALF